MTLPPDLAIQNTESASNIEIHLRPANLRHGIKNAKSDKRMSHIAFCLPHGHTIRVYEYALGSADLDTSTV